MPGRRQALSAAAVISIVALCSTPARVEGPNASAAVASRVSAEVIGLTNRERAGHGRAKLHASTRLMHAAQIHAEQMARAERLAHVLPDATYPRAEDRLARADYHWRTYGENVALGQSSAAHALESWMHSRGHRKNILDEDFTEIGAGYAIDRAGRPYFVQLFGSPSP